MISLQNLKIARATLSQQYENVENQLKKLIEEEKLKRTELAIAEIFLKSLDEKIANYSIGWNPEE